MSTRGGAPVVAERVLALSLLAIVALAAAPFAVATVFSARRISAAQADTERLAGALRGAGANDAETRVLIGAGNLPVALAQQEWLRGPSAPLRESPGSREGEVPVDPWRNAYLANIGARGPVWVLSAGANGEIETPFDGATAPAGDDVAHRVR